MLVLNLASWETRHDDAEDNNHNKQFKLGSIIFCESATNVMIVCVLRIIILIIVHVDPVGLIERVNALLVLSTIFY